MKVELKVESVSCVGLNDLSIGETGQVVSGRDGKKHEVGHIILRTYDGFVDLTDPEHTWDHPIREGNSIRLERKEFKLVEV